MSLKSQCTSSSPAASKQKKATSSRMSDSDGLEDEVTDEKGVIKRKSRNLSEKKRRDQFNILINELCSMVCTGKRKMDKSTILKSAISFIRNHNQMTTQSHCQESVQEDWKPSFLSNEEFTHLMLEALDEFILVFSATGKILYVSENITCLLGHTPSDLLGFLITDLVWEGERNLVESMLGSYGSNYGNDRGCNENQINLKCHLRRGNVNEINFNNYEYVYISGHTRIQGNPDISSASRISSSWGEDSKESANYGDALSHYHGLVFVASVRLQTPQLLVEMPVIDGSKSEFISRHSLEWKFLFLDHRGPPIIGYLPFEVLGTSGYDYYHADDLDNLAMCHEALMQKGELTSCYYRFLTKGQQWIWLQTKYYITYHQWYSKPEFVVCSHRVISFNEVISSQKTVSTSDRVGEPRNVAGDCGFSKQKSETKPLPQNNKNDKPEKRGLDDSDTDRSNQKETSNFSNHERSTDDAHHRFQNSLHQRWSNGPASECQQPDNTETLKPPTMGSAESASQHSRHPLGGPRRGTAFSDAGSVSSSGSFQSAASQHSGQSNQSMHSMHSQQSHHSMQSVHSQQSQQTQSSTRSTNQQPCSASLSSITNTCHHQQHNSRQQTSQLPPQQVTSSNNSQLRNMPQYSHNLPKATENSSAHPPPISVTTSSIINTGHRFLQPRVNSLLPVRRGIIGSCSSMTSVASSPPSSAAGSFTYQSVVPIGGDNGLGSAVTVPVQRIIEGLPVVTLPGIVAHEPLVLTPAQKALHEQLRMKHMEIQKSILAQQEELRRISEKLILTHYGAWGQSVPVLKMAVPYSDSEGTSNQPAHTVIGTGGLVTCLTTESPFSLGQISSTQAGNASLGSMTFSPGTPILVHSPEFHHSQSPDRTNDMINMSTDPSQVVLRTAIQQETLVQLSPQDIQMLLQHSNFLP